MDLSDEELIELAQEGSRSAFASIIERHTAAVFRMALRVVGNREDAEEASQDAFVRAFRALDKFRRDAKFSTWLYRITMNVCLTKARQSRPDVTSIDASMDDEDDSAPLQIPDQGDNPDQLVERSEFQQRVRDLIASLPPKSSAVLTLYHIQNLSYEEISEALELPIGTVKAHLFRARNALKKTALTAFEPQELK
jgi:RNA polymerase sigma-70 factor (ECF subfamily)